MLSVSEFGAKDKNCSKLSLSFQRVWQTKSPSTAAKIQQTIPPASKIQQEVLPAAKMQQTIPTAAKIQQAVPPAAKIMQTILPN
jgi:hypothetical protein